MKLILASNNKDKLREIREILPEHQIISLREAGIELEPEETGATFTENARIKALAALTVTGLPCVADDSGLEVNAMDNGPGVYSSRFCGDRSYRETCEEIMSIVDGSGDRGARFRCAVVCELPGGGEITAEGVVEGTIGRVFEGEHGFGYDPIFVPEGFERSMACLTDEEKNRISHRGRAFRDFEKKLSIYMEKRETKE